MQKDLPIDQTPQDTQPTYPTGLGGNAALPLGEQLYLQKVDFLEGVLQQQTGADLSAQRGTLINALGGHREVERADVWEAVKKNEASRAHREVDTILIEESANIAKPSEDRDIFDTIAAQVAVDMRGTTEPGKLAHAPDTVDFSTGGELGSLIETDELDDPVVLAKATKAIRLLVVDGLYKVNRWGNADQLNTALRLIETYTEWVPDFNPNEAGLGEAKASLTMSLAAIQVDQDSKPNYQYAKPERAYLVAQTAGGLKQIRRTDAHMFLRYRDFELPEEETESDDSESS